MKMDETVAMLGMAARAAYRAAGDVEPNPMVGAVVVRDGRVIGVGHHRRYGALHAEREALADCARRAESPRGSAVYVTLEPCSHHGKQPPCTEALIEAGVARVVYARPDPHETSGGGAELLRTAGIECALSDVCPAATHISDPFVKRIRTGLPWVIAKWAQTVDGRMTTPEGESPWISNALSLRRVHRLRARVDAIVTGAGTVIADDPGLTARGVPRVRRSARRVVVQGVADVPRTAQIFHPPQPAVTIVSPRDEWPLVSAASSTDDGEIETLFAPGEMGRVSLTTMLRHLAEEHDATNVMLECGPTLLRSFLDAGLVDEALVYVARPREGDEWDAVRGLEAVRDLTLVRSKPLGDNIEAWFRRPVEP